MKLKLKKILECPCYAVENNQLEESFKTLVQSGSYTVAINAEKIMTQRSDNELKKVIEDSIFPYPDGAGATLALKYLFGLKSEKIFLPLRSLEIADKNKYSVYIYGAEQDVHDKAISIIKNTYKNLNILGSRNGFEDRVLAKRDILELNPDITLVAIGSPRQEKFARDVSENRDHGIIIGCGGALDVISGKFKRAPEFMVNNNLEFLYRLFLEPSRIVRQVVYFKFSALLLKKIIQNRFSSFFSS